MRFLFLLLSIFFFFDAVFFFDAEGKEKIEVLTSSSLLASLVKEIGGEYVSVKSIVRGDEDNHAVEARPSFFILASKADLFILQGLSYEDTFLKPILLNSGNPKIREGREGFLNLGDFVMKEGKILQRIRPLTRAFGDIHPFGNPHWTLHPRNIKISAFYIKEKLKSILPQEGDYFERRYSDFISRFTLAIDSLMSEARPTKVITHHKEGAFEYFADYFGFEIVDSLEEFAGIPPSSKRIMELQEIARKNCDIILYEIYYGDSAAKKLSQISGCPYSYYYHDIFGEVKDIISLFKKNFEILRVVWKGRK